jgi:hypothetical protein
MVFPIYVGQGLDKEGERERERGREDLAAEI